MIPKGDDEELAILRKVCLCEREVANCLVALKAIKARTCCREAAANGVKTYTWDELADKCLKLSADEEGLSVVDYCRRNKRPIPSWAYDYDAGWKAGEKEDE